MRESEVLKICMLAAAECGATVFRNNRGLFREARRDRFLRAGLEAKGASDLVGWTCDGRFLAIECKTDTSRPSKEQTHFINLVNQAGGIGFIARNAEDVKAKLCVSCNTDMQ
jgi:hypothetical protein